MDTARLLKEGYGDGAWHGAEMKAALTGVSAADAFRRPAPGRHNIAEIAVHHAFYQHAIRGRLTGGAIEPFPLAGEDWFALDDERAMAWSAIIGLVGDLQRHLVETAEAIEAGRQTSPLSASEREDLLLGITCHAVYHAGQVQLVKALLA